MLMPTLQSAELWRESGRYEAYGPEMLRIRDRHEREMLYGPTNEEMITALFRDDVKSYRDLPRTLYHIQWKFRDEVRPRFGVMRGREFLMKDAYSFDLDEAGARQSYNRQMRGLPSHLPADGHAGGADERGDRARSAATSATSSSCSRRPARAKSSTTRRYEEIDWQRPASTTAMRRPQRHLRQRSAPYAATDETHDVASGSRSRGQAPHRPRDRGRPHLLLRRRNIPRRWGSRFRARTGAGRPHMGSYGVGVSRLVGAIIEASHDEAGIMWPDAVAPWRVGLVTMRADDEASADAAGQIYAQLEAAGVETLYDDRDERGGVKLGSMDLIGLPWQVIVGPRGIAAGTVELKRRSTGEREELSIESALARLTS